MYATLREKVKWSSRDVELNAPEVTLSKLLDLLLDLKDAMYGVGLEHFIILATDTTSCYRRVWKLGLGMGM